MLHAERLLKPIEGLDAPAPRALGAQPVLVEINTVLQSLLLHQMENGPIPAEIAAEWAARAPFRLVGGLLVRKPPRD